MPRLDVAIHELPEPIRDDTRRIVSASGVIPSADVARWTSSLGIDTESLMVELLPVAAAFACAPISSYCVGAVVRGESTGGQPAALYFGANLEFPAAGLATTIHAEQAAVNNAWLHGETGLQSLAVTAAPCGHCRQFLWELTTAADLVILQPMNGSAANDSYTKHSLTELLPAPFGPADLGKSERLLQRASQGLSGDVSDSLAQQALSAANASYAPVTGNFAGMALLLSDGRVVTGRYAENAAFNPSLTPLASALSRSQMDRPSETMPEIVEAVLVEVPTTVSQRFATESLLRAIAPVVPLRYVTATRRK